MSQSSELSAAVSPASPKEQFLSAFEKEHSTTMRVLRAYPSDRLDLRPHPRCKTARELAWVFVVERGMGIAVFNNELEKLMASGGPPEPPESWDQLLAALEGAHREYGDLIRSTPEDRMLDRVRFLTAPNTVGELTRMEWVWFLLHDEIHHRGQFSVYLRMADARVPSIYGPTADEPWM